MSDSLLDEALRCCEDGILDMRDTPTRSDLRARHGVLSRAVWSLSLLPAKEDQVVGVAKLVLRLRDDVVEALAADPSS